MMVLSQAIRTHEYFFKYGYFNASDLTRDGRRVSRIITEIQQHMLLDGRSIIQPLDIFKGNIQYLNYMRILSE